MNDRVSGQNEEERELSPHELMNVADKALLISIYSEAKMIRKLLYAGHCPPTKVIGETRDQEAKP